MLSQVERNEEWSIFNVTVSKIMTSARTKSKRFFIFDIKNIEQIFLYKKLLQ